jgi:hypothetical protein
MVVFREDISYVVDERVRVAALIFSSRVLCGMCGSVTGLRGQSSGHRVDDM